MDEPILAWHFLPDDGRLRHERDRPKVQAGKVFVLGAKQKPSLCVVGFHGSVRPLDALQYAPGSLVCRVQIWGDVQHGDDKLCGRNREVLWMADATQTLHEFSADAAEWILNRLEAKGEKIDPRSRAAITAKRAWLKGEISDEQLAAAWAAALAAARAAARDAAWAAALAAAWDAARAAARDAARDELNAMLEARLNALEMIDANS